MKNHTDIPGIVVGDTEFKITSYADNVALSLSNPVKTFSKLFNLLYDFGLVSGYKVNRNKTKIFTYGVSHKNLEGLMYTSGCQINPPMVKYLGIYIDKDLGKLFLNNYERILKCLTSDLKYWDILNLSWSARMSAVKMNILPKFNFLFQNLPISIKDKVIQNWQRQINSFIWRNKKARIAFSILQDETSRGGLKFPNLLLYYHASKLVWIKDWMDDPFNIFLQAEKSDLGLGFHDTLWPDSKSKKQLGKHWVRNSLLNTWKKYQLRYQSSGFSTKNST